MSYIIENANILKDNHFIRKSVLIRDNRIAALENKINRYHFMKMNAEPYILTPTFVLLNSKIPVLSQFATFKKYMTEEFILKGCTTFLTYVSVSSERDLHENIEKMKTLLLSSPIDFLIGAKIPLTRITPAFIRSCKKEKISTIFMEIQGLDDFNGVPWGWIREALFPYNCTFFPIISEELKKQEKAILAKWRETLVYEKISGIDEIIEENMPLKMNVLNKIGLIPQKSCFRHGAEVSYNLYLKSREIKNIDEKQLFLYHKDRLVVTVHKGNVIRAGVEVLFKPGNGEYVKVNIPSYFSIP
ncbi:MAG: hypothetical protein Q8934_04565 [Bacillota bacterium]|nr:hypothetical protein [Bacillota bacterium]